METQEFLKQKLESVKGVGAKTGKLFASIGLQTVRDLLQHYPYRYEDYSNIKKINQLQADEQVTIKASVTSISSRTSFKNKRLKITEAILTDDTGNITATWFNQPYLANVLNRGQVYYFSGSTIFRKQLQMQNPQFESIEGSHTSVGRLVPLYSLPGGISQKRYRGIVQNLLNVILSPPQADEESRDPSSPAYRTGRQTPQDDTQYDILPDNLKKELHLKDLTSAWSSIHFPDSWSDLEKARARLGFDELLIFQLQILQRKQNLQQAKAPKIPFAQKDIKKFVSSLPFTLTLSQRKTAWEIIQDLQKDQPMNRLLQGDVGSGKTVVAAIAAYSAARAGYQTAFLAPTEILARQHYETISELLEPYEIPAALLTGSTKPKEKNEIYKAISQGKIDVAIGTHALLHDKVKFKNLGLLIVDEQHRFGVKQRSTLRQAQGKLQPHLLSTTATPIPRTLALTLYGDLSISSITELPPGRQKVETRLIPHHQRQKAYALIRKEILAGRQCFVICPLVEESDVLETKSATAERDRLAKEVFPDFSVELIHGQMKPTDKERIMKEFKEGLHHILVSTSVIEVGIDIPNATVMLIEGAERFGLAQLHQFRGRVGRGENQSYCLVIPTGNEISSRLHALTRHHNGFVLAELDLKFRGMGQLTGTKQSGFFDFKIADPADINLVKKARETAQDILQKDPNLKKHPGLAEIVNKKEVLHPE